MEELENHPANRCVGCGPANPAGLRLRFHRDGDSVRTTLTAGPEHEGWPDRLHSAILYLAMIETANWTLYGLTGRVGLPARTSALDLRAMLPTGAVLQLTGRLTHRDGGAATARVEAVREGHGPVAYLERGYELLGRDEFLERMGYDEVPPGLEDALP